MVSIRDTFVERESPHVERSAVLNVTRDSVQLGEKHTGEDMWYQYVVSLDELNGRIEEGLMEPSDPLSEEQFSMVKDLCFSHPRSTRSREERVGNPME